MSDPHEAQIALAPAYVLGALDADDRRVFDQHLATCATCAAEVHALAFVTSSLAFAVQPVTPRAHLRTQLLAALDASSPSGARASSRTAVPTWLPYAALLVMAAGLGLYAAGLRARVLDLEGRLDRATTQMLASDRVMAEMRRVAFDTQSAMAVLAAPDLARIDLAGEAVAPQASARALWSRQRGMVFTATNLPALPGGRIYQVWVVTGDAPVSAGLLAPDVAGRGIGVFATPPDIGAPLAVAVTIEPEGGVPAPTGARFLIGAPAPQI